MNFDGTRYFFIHINHDKCYTVCTNPVENLCHLSNKLYIIPNITYFIFNNHESSVTDITNDVPQGSVLGPLVICYSFQ